MAKTTALFILSPLTLGLMLVAVSARAQTPLPGPHPTPRPAPAVNVLLENHTLPELGGYADGLGRLGSTLRMPLISTYAGILGGFAAVHDARREAAEQARSQANAAMDRDLRAAGITGFRLDSCRMSPSSCAELQGRFSAATHAAIGRYLNAASRYSAWSDLGNVTGQGWTDAERKTFVKQASGGALSALADRALQTLQDKARQPSWDPEERPSDMVQDDIKGAATARLDGFLSEMRQQAGEAKPLVVESEFHPARGPEADRALQALVDQGRAIDQLNATPIDRREDPAYSEAFGARVDQEVRALDAAARHSDAQAHDFYRGMERQNARIRTQVEALRALGVHSPQPQPPKPSSSPRPENGAPASPTSAGTKAPARPDHCAGGAFKCPNGRPWPKCTHPEKYRCPPAEHAAEAARHNQGTDRTSSPPIPKP